MDIQSVLEADRKKGRTDLGRVVGKKGKNCCAFAYVIEVTRHVISMKENMFYEMKYYVKGLCEFKITGDFTSEGLFYSFWFLICVSPIYSLCRNDKCAPFTW